MHIRSLILANCAMLAVSGICFAPAAEGSGAASAIPEGGGAPPALTTGGYRVGVTFNPSQSPNVDRIKAQAASLIDTILAIVPEGERSEAARCAAIACTAIEDGAMWAVKAATKQPRA